MSQAHVDVVEQLLKAYASGDIEGVFAALHPDCVIHEAHGLPYAAIGSALPGSASCSGRF